MTSKRTAAAWTALAVVDGLFFLENTPLRSSPALMLWLALAVLVGGFVALLRQIGMLDAAAADGTTRLGPRVRWRSPEFWGTLLVAGASGALLAWISPPANLHQLHWFGLLPMFWALRRDRFWENFAASWAYGSFALTLIFVWVVDTIALYSNIPKPIAFSLLLLGSGALFGWLYLPAWIAVHPLRDRLGGWWILLFPTVLVATEYFVSFIIVFPYQMGVAHYRSPAVWQLASVTGVWGVSWLVGFVNAGFAEVIYRQREGRPFPHFHVAAAVSALSLVVIWGTWRFGQVEELLRTAPKIRVAQMQSPHDMVYRLSHPSREAFEEWVFRTRAFRPGTVDLAVWPEGASPYDLNEGTAHDLIAELARRGRMEVIAGGGTRVRVDDPTLGKTVRQFNSVFYFDEQGQVSGRYDKMVPLLFGEYLPWWLNWLHDYVQGIGDFNAGTVPVVFETEHARVASPICYEAIFGGICRRFPDTSLFVTVTNDAWFGDTAAPHQHGMLAALRATELGIPMVRSAYSGISFVVEPHGHLHAETKPFTEVARVVEVRLATVPTLYARFGDWFPWLCVIATIGVVAASHRLGQRMSSQGQAGEGSG